MIIGHAYAQPGDTIEINLSKVSGTAKAKLFNKYTGALLTTNPERALDIGIRGVAFCEELNNKNELANAYKNLGMIYRNNRDRDQAKDYLIKAFELAEEIKDYDLAASASLNLGTSFFGIDDYQKGLEYYLASLKYAEKIGSEKAKAKAMSGIGLIYMNDGKLKEALEINMQAVHIFEELKEEKDIARMHNVIANVYDEMKEYDKALDYYKKSISAWEKMGNQIGIGGAFLSIGDVYRKQKMWDEAEFYFLKSMDIISAAGEGYQDEVYCYQYLGEVMEVKGNSQRAQEYYLHAVELAKKLHMKKNLSSIYHDLSDLYEKKGDYKTALAYHDLHVSYYDSVFSADKERLMNEMQARFENDQKQKEIEILKKEHTITQITWITGGSLVFLLAIIAFLIINRKRLRAKKDAALFVQQRKLLEAELNNKQLLEDQLHEKIEFNNRSLTAYTLNLIHKNEMLEDVKSQVEIMKRSPDAELPSRLQHLLKTVNYSIHLDKDWENFKFHFEQVHKGFFDNVKAAFPDLTMNDLFLCSLIRLNLETKQIATLMDISADSAKVSRSRLRKKLNLATEQNLVEFLNTF